MENEDFILDISALLVVQLFRNGFAVAFTSIEFTRLKPLAMPSWKLF